MRKKTGRKNFSALLLFMELPHYSYKINKDFLDYEFASAGPKGRIKISAQNTS
jgi:hypothetical protein